EDAGIVGLRGEGTERAALTLPAAFVSIGHLADAAHGHLGAQTEFPAQTAVGDLMQIILPEGLRVPSFFGEEVTGCVRARQSFVEQGCLRRGRPQLDGGSELHRAMRRLGVRRYEIVDRTTKNGEMSR